MPVLLIYQLCNYLAQVVRTLFPAVGEALSKEERD